MIWDKIEEKINETFKSDNKKQDEATDEKEKTSPHIPVSYAPFVKHIAEKYGLGDAEDFQRRINAINKFVDNKEAHFNTQRLSSLQKIKDIKDGKTAFIHGAETPEIAIKNWQGGADIAEEMLKNEGLKIYTPEELNKAFMDGKYLTGKEGIEAASDAFKATSEFSKKGQKVPFKNTNINEYPRQGVAKATKKFNIVKKAVDVLSNAKLNTFLDLLLTPTPLYEPSVEDIRKKNGLDKLDFSLEKVVQPSDNQNE